MKHIIFSDIDGTIYDESLNIDKKTIKDIGNARELGVEIMIATGNGFFNQVRDVASKIGANYAITSNGASIYDLYQEKFILKEVIPAETANNILQYANKHDISGTWWDEQNVYASENQKEKIIDIVTNLMKPKNGIIRTNQIENDIFKIEFYDSPEKIDLIEEEVNGLGFQTARMKPHHVEITHIGVSKGSAVKFMLDKFGTSKDEVMSIGDSSNDLPMFRETKHSYAMANGAEHVHENAAYHTSAVNQNGLGRAIEDFIFRLKIK